MAPDEERRLTDALARSSDPSLMLDGVCEFLGDHGVELATVDDERLDDLVLAWACAWGSAAAIERFREAHIAMIKGIGARVFDAVPMDDFEQKVMTHLLVREGEGPPRIGRYGGRGPLRAFVRMAVSRLAIDLRRAGGVQPTPASDLDKRMRDELDPDDALVTAEAKALFRDAIKHALEGLRPAERRALRMRYVMGFSVARTAEALQMHEVSVSRLVTRVRNQIADRVHKELAERGEAPETGELARLARSLDVSVARWLQTHRE